MKKHKSSRIRSMLISAFVCILALLILIVSPWGITRLQLQNRIFTIDNIDTVLRDDKLQVTLDISAHNFFPWKITVDDIHFKAMGEYNILFDELTTDILPLNLSFCEKRTFSVRYAFDVELYKESYASSEREDASSLENNVRKFIQSARLIFVSDDIPTGNALCMAWYP